MSPVSRPSYDAVVVGARVAGASTAMLLARQGLRVLAIDHAREGSDTLSTHALVRPGVLQLRRWGLLDRVARSGAAPIRSATFYYGRDATTVPIEPRGGVDALYAPRRTVLDPILVGAAREAGAEVRFGTRLAGLRFDGQRVVGARIAARGQRTVDVDAPLVIGADGIRSAVAAAVGAGMRWRGIHATSCVYSHFRGVALEGYHWFFAEGAAAGIIPSNDGVACVFAVVPPERFVETTRHDLAGDFAAALRQAAPSAADAVMAAERVAPLRAFAGQDGYLRESAGPGWALVGDAGHFKDPLTAHGMTDALRDAELLARAAVAGRLPDYQEERDSLSGRLLQIADAIASFEWTLEELANLHLEMNREVKRETRAITAFDARDARAA